MESKLGAQLPLRVPDRTLDTTEPMWQKERLGRYFLHNASGNQSGQPESVELSGSYVLRECGICCGVVGSERHAEWGHGSEEAAEMGQTIPKACPHLADASRFKERGKTEATFWITILMDTVGENGDRKMASLRRASEADYIEYKDLLTYITNGSDWLMDDDRIYFALETATLLRRFFITEDSHFGIGSARMEKGDEVFVLRSGR